MTNTSIIKHFHIIPSSNLSEELERTFHCTNINATWQSKPIRLLGRPIFRITLPKSDSILPENPVAMRGAIREGIKPETIKAVFNRIACERSRERSNKSLFPRDRSARKTVLVRNGQIAFLLAIISGIRFRGGRIDAALS